MMVHDVMKILWKLHLSLRLTLIISFLLFYYHPIFHEIDHHNSLHLTNTFYSFIYFCLSYLITLSSFLTKPIYPISMSLLVAFILSEIPSPLLILNLILTLILILDFMVNLNLNLILMLIPMNPLIIPYRDLKSAFTLRAHTQSVSGLQVCGDSSSNKLYSCSWDHSLKEWDIEVTAWVHCDSHHCFSHCPPLSSSLSYIHV